MKKSAAFVVLTLTFALCLNSAFAQNSLQGKFRGSNEPDFAEGTEKTFDSLWNDYFRGENDSVIDIMLSYADSSDLLTAALNQDLESICDDRTYMDILTGLGTNLQDGKFVSSTDLEIVGGFLFRDSITASDADYIYSFFTNELKNRAVIKSNAFWSLLMNAQKYQTVSLELQKRLPVLSDDVRSLFCEYLNLLKTGAFFEGESDGSVNFSEGALVIKASLASALGTPLVWFSNFEGGSYPVMYDVELLASDEHTVLRREKELLLTDREVSPADGLVLRPASNVCSLSVSESDPKGKLFYRLTFYTPWSVIAVTDLPFTH